MNGAANRPVIAAGSAGAERWELPQVDGRLIASFGREGAPELPTSKRLEALQRQAWEQGHSLGQEAGRAQGYADAKEAADRIFSQRLRQLEALFNVLDAPFATLDAQVERGIVDLAILVARQLVRRELRIDPGEVVGVVREAISQLPVAARRPRIHLHPDDAELVRAALPVDGDAPGWRIEADPLITRGGCFVETTASIIDATVESRLAAIVAKTLGGERAGDREP